MPTPPSSAPPSFPTPMQREQQLNWRAQFTENVRQNVKNYLHSQFVSSCPSISSELLLSRACSFEDREFALANSQENYFHRLAQGLDKFQYICSKNAFRPSQTPIFSTSLPTPSQYTQLNEVGHQSRQPSTQMGSQRQASSPSNSQPFFVNQSLASSQYPNHVGAFTQGQMANSASASTQQPCLPLNNISTGQFYPKHNESNGNVNFYSPSVHIPYTKPKSTIQQKPPKPPARSGIAISKKKPPTPRSKKSRSRKKGQGSQSLSQKSTFAAAKVPSGGQTSLTQQKLNFPSAQNAGFTCYAPPPGSFSMIQGQQPSPQAVQQPCAPAVYRPKFVPVQQSRAVQNVPIQPKHNIYNAMVQPWNLAAQSNLPAQNGARQMIPIPQPSTQEMLHGEKQASSGVMNAQSNERAIAEQVVKYSLNATGEQISQEKISGLSAGQVQKILAIINNKDLDATGKAGANEPSFQKTKPAKLDESKFKAPNSTLPPDAGARTRNDAPIPESEKQRLSQVQLYRNGKCHMSAQPVQTSGKADEMSRQIGDAVRPTVDADCLGTETAKHSTMQMKSVESEERGLMAAEGESVARNQKETLQIASQTQKDQIGSCYTPVGCDNGELNLPSLPPVQQTPKTGIQTERPPGVHQTEKNIQKADNDPNAAAVVKGNVQEVIVKLTKIQRKFKKPMHKVMPFIHRERERFSFQLRSLFTKRLEECWGILNVTRNMGKDGKTFISVPAWLTLSSLMKMEMFMYHLLRTTLKTMHNRKQKLERRKVNNAGEDLVAQSSPVQTDLNLPTVASKFTGKDSEQGPRCTESSLPKVQELLRKRPQDSSLVQSSLRSSEGGIQTPQTTQQTGPHILQKKLRQNQHVSSEPKSHAYSVTRDIGLHPLQLSGGASGSSTRTIAGDRPSQSLDVQTNSKCDSITKGVFSTANRLNLSDVTGKIAKVGQDTRGQKGKKASLSLQQKKSRDSASVKSIERNGADKRVMPANPEPKETYEDLLRKAMSISTFAKKVQQCSKLWEDHADIEMKDRKRRRIEDTLTSIRQSPSLCWEQNEGRQQLSELKDTENSDGSKIIKSKCLFECSTENGLMLTKKLKWSSILEIVKEDCQAVRESFPTLRVEIEENFGLPVVRCSFENEYMQLPKLVIFVERGYPRRGGTRYGFERPALGWVKVLGDIKHCFQAALEMAPSRIVSVGVCLHAWADAANNILNKSHN